jgi:hypothetical protein
MSRVRSAIGLAMTAAIGACSLFVDTSDLSDGSGASDAMSDVIDASQGDSGGGDASSNDAGADATDSYAALILADSPIAYFRLNETSGTTIQSAVNLYTGSFFRGVALGTPSPIGRDPSNLAATFSMSDGGVVDSDLTLGDNFTFPGLQPFSAEAWIMPTDTEYPSHVLSKADRSPEVHGWNICVGAGPVVWFERGDPLVTHSAEVPISLNVWSHVVGVYDGTQLLIYVNGVSGSLVITPDASIGVAATAAFMGSANGGAEEGHGFIGVIDEVAIYDKALSTTQVLAHYSAGKP